MQLSPKNIRFAKKNGTNTAEKDPFYFYGRGNFTNNTNGKSNRKTPKKAPTEYQERIKELFDEYAEKR